MTRVPSHWVKINLKLHHQEIEVSRVLLKIFNDHFEVKVSDKLLLTLRA